MQTRLNEADYEQMKELTIQTGKSTSELARDFIHSSLVGTLNDGVSC